MAETNEPRALSAALAGPAFATRGTGLAMHLADRHIERWAPEQSAGRVRPMRALGFVDRLIAPWIEAAQRSASHRMFDQYAQAGFGERPGGAVSWVFPRPWYQDEIDWMAAARRAPRPEPAMLTTRGTYVAQQQPPMAMPASLYEYVAPSMSIAQPAAVAGVGHGGTEAVHADAYSPLIPLAAVQAAHLMARAVAPAIAPKTAGDRMSPALRGVLAAMLERASVARAEEPSRLSRSAPELVTPPAPRPAEAEEAAAVSARPDGARATAAEQVAEHYAAQRARIVELQRIAQRTAERELAARAQAQAASQVQAQAGSPSQTEAGSRAAEVREAARRAEAQLRESAAARVVSEEQRQRIEADRTAAAATERARLEERVAQRVAERTAAQRLHEQARTEAAAHARSAIEAQAAPAAAETERAPIAARRPPPEVASAIAALPPELAAFIGQRPERAMQAIEELDVALRTIELIARGAATGASFEATRGPRLVMPAGLGGLVSAVDRTTASPWLGGAPAGLPAAAAPSVLPGAARPFAPGLVSPAWPVSSVSPAVPVAGVRVPALPWLAAAAPRPFAASGAAPGMSGAMPGAPAPAPMSALAAAAAAPPAALAHVAWADRWLARFAGASKTSLDTLAAPSRLDTLAAAAPAGVFVSPSFDAERDAPPARNVDRLLAAAARPLTLIPSPASVIRYADDAETPDDVFAAISAGATRQRTQSAASPERAAAAEAAVTYADRTPADAIAASAPAAPAAGLSAQLAASPFAPALRHVLPMPSVASFDVRSLFGGGLSATYLAGLLAADSREVELATRALPSWAAAGLEGFAGLASAAAEPVAERQAPTWDAAYVAPAEPGADAIETAEAVPTGAEAPAAIPYAAAAAAERAAQAQAIAAAAPITTLRASLLSWTADVPSIEGAPGAAFPITGAPGLAGTTAFAGAPGIVGAPGVWVGLDAAEGTPAPVSTARTMLEAMSLPMLGDTSRADDRGGSWAAPGMVASRAHSWSVAQERSASDLALDFVTPELVLAARVYGLGPSEAAQAARLAIAGSGHLTAMAGTVDRAFLQAMAIDADRRERVAALMTAYPLPAGGLAAAVTEDAGAPRADRADRAAAMAVEPARAEAARIEPPRAAPAAAAQLSGAAALGAPGGTAFGVDRRAPRGAFLWPSASVAALGLNAAMPEGEIAMSVAALELLAARAVAELGTFAALEPPAPGEVAGIAGAGSAAPAGAEAVAGDESAAEMIDAVTGAAGGPRGRLPLVAGAPSVDGGAAAGAAPAPLGEPGEREVLAAADALVPPTRRARFEALYLALGQSTAGRGWSPAARAARALALAGQTEDASLSARERAAAAWDVLPAVYATEGLLDGATGLGPDGAPAAAARSWAAAGSLSGSPAGSLVGSLAGFPGGVAAASRGSRGASAAPSEDWAMGYVAPSGLGALSARAGEALGAYVAPAAPAAPAATSSSESAPRELGAVHRAPTAMQELVRTGRPAGRYGGGEVEIPPWFEAAARKMFENQGVSDGISLADLTLVTAAPATQIAASTRTQPGAGPVTPSVTGATEKQAGPGAHIDVETVAQEIYRHILTIMDAARARNGEPYL